jgi:hypothetical protein
MLNLPLACATTTTATTSFANTSKLLDAYNFAKRLKTLNGLTPFQSVCKTWTKEPNRFKYDPVQLTLGLQT